MSGASRAAFQSGEGPIRSASLVLLWGVAWLALAARLRSQAPPAEPSSAATALVLGARAYDRANQLDSARRAYDAAALLLPSIADWLSLRAAGVTPDSVGRDRYYKRVVVPVARGRIAWTEAEARERSGDFAGAARAYAMLGDSAGALRNTADVVGVTGDSAARSAFQLRLFGVMERQPATAAARSAVELADRLFAPLTPAQERLAARSAALGGMPSRAAAGFERVLQAEGAAALSPEDTYAYATTLLRMHRDTDASRVFATLASGHAPAALAHAAAYQRARVMLAGGDRLAAQRLLATTVRRASRDTVAASALMLLADLAADDRHDDVARRDYLRVAHEFPASPLASRAVFRAALLAWLAGNPGQAAREWDRLVARYPRSDDAVAASYWAGRAWARGDHIRLARERWRTVVRTDPLSYYAPLAARRLEARGLLAVTRTDTAVAAVAPVMDSALARVKLLDAVGMSVESRFELDRVLHQATDADASMVAVGAALSRLGEPSRAIALGWRLIGRSDSAWRDVRVLRLIYPLLYGDTLAALARGRGLEPSLVAAVVRQESGFNPRAVSVAGARGLMQVMPAVGRSLTQGRGTTNWDPEALDQPELNLQLGITHLATFYAQEHRDMVRTLAAYNAGPSRVRTWSRRGGVEDPEVFVERIPFTETRDYVRAILRGREAYATLYGL